jgi:protein-L-isoaspartate(D-aspartate) O-methyltransferase
MFLPTVWFTLLAGITIPVSAQNEYRELRSQMVESQLKGRDIRDKATLQAMEKVPRHQFVPEDLQRRAYDDSPLPIGQGQTISQPYIVAFMTQALKLQPHDKVLEIGTGSGYQAAILGQLVDSVFTIEIVPELGKAASTKLRALNYGNIEVRIGDGYHGWPSKAPFDAIMVTAGAEEIPRPLLDQLADGGLLVIPVGPHRGVRQLKLIERKGNRFRERNLMAVRFVPFTRGEEN